MARGFNKGGREMSAYEPIKTAEIHDGNGRLYSINFATISYSVAGFGTMDGRGRVQRVFGCKSEREAFNLARRLAKKAGRDVSKWKLVLVSPTTSLPTRPE
jgi:hypothetical protein